MFKTIYTLIVFSVYVVIAEFDLDLERDLFSNEQGSELGGIILGSSSIMIIFAVLATAVGSIILVGCLIGCCCSRMASNITRKNHL